MAENQGKDEEKFDFTGEGEAVGYISLAQAGVLAVQTAGKPRVSTVVSTKTFPWPLRCPTGRIPKTMKTSTPSAVLPAHRAGPPQSGITRSHLSWDLQFSRWPLGFC